MAAIASALQARRTAPYRPPAIRMATAERDHDDAALYLDRAHFHALVRAMPKAELHTHIEGSVRAETILDLAKKYRLPLPAPTVDALRQRIGMRPGENLLDFLKKFDCFRFVFDRPETLRRLAYETIEDNALENCRYTEIRINPLKNADRIGIGQVLDATLAGMNAARRKLGVEACLIASINRSYPLDKAWEVARAAVARKDQGVVGLDLAGDEIHHPAAKFKDVFQYAKAHGLHITIHAGEACGPQSMRQAIEDCGAERIGHGVRAQEDPAMLALLRHKGIPLEMCPTSNLLLDVVEDIARYPLARYVQAGIKTTINTDDRGIFAIDLSGENTRVAAGLDLSLQDLEQLNLNGVEASFLPPQRKAALHRQFLRDMAAFERTLPGRLANG